MSSSSPVLLSHAPSSSSKLGLSLVAGVALLGCQIGAAAAQSKTFPSDLVGTWCNLNQGTSTTYFEIRTSELEEGEGVCTLRRLKIDKLNGNFELTMSCDSGVEGEKGSPIRTELFNIFQMQGRRHMLRFGSMYDRKALSLWKLETPTDSATPGQCK